MKKKIFIETEETTIRKVKTSFEIETDYIQLYKNFIKVSSRITSVTTFKLLHWLLAERLDRENYVNSGRMFFDFNDYLLTQCGSDCQISKPTFYRCLDELVNVGAINKIEKGHYLANIHLFWGDDVGERITTLKEFEKDENPNIKFLNPYDKELPPSPLS